MTPLKNMTPQQIWSAWRNQKITAGDLANWQEKNDYYFNETGGQILDRRLFHRLERDTFYKGAYVVLNDGNHYASFYANSDADAILKFRAGDY